MGGHYVIIIDSCDVDTEIDGLEALVGIHREHDFVAVGLDIDIDILNLVGIAGPFHVAFHLEADFTTFLGHHIGTSDCYDRLECHLGDSDRDRIKAFGTKFNYTFTGFNKFIGSHFEKE